MRVTLSPEVFAAPADHTLIISIFRYALDGRHRVETELHDPSVASWLRAQSRSVQEEIGFAVDWSVEAEALEPSATHLVASLFDRSHWLTRPLQIRIDQVRNLLDTPFSVVLEDATSDREFLLKMLTTEERAFVTNQIKHGFVRIEHGGGLSMSAII